MSNSSRQIMLDNSVVTWTGGSKLDGRTIMLIISGLTRPSCNTKTKGKGSYD